MNCPNCGQQVPPFRNPVPTVDIIIEVSGGIVLIERKGPPHGLALPGGFVDYGESLEQAAVREAKEETGLDITLSGQLHTYSNPERDTRLHTISTVFTASAQGLPQGGSDALSAHIYACDNIPKLVFDHNRIVADFLRLKA